MDNSHQGSDSTFEVGVRMHMMLHAVPCASVSMCIAQVGGAHGAGVKLCVAGLVGAPKNSTKRDE